ncbi:PREDICTED: ADP-ribosylation factor-binding protein GGA3 [Polistes dominula]|uniref:ADP-ribosylation factor-binding protein GGA3 n=2 Tax=Apocrita TaxID=7400 RepID=A0ABM1J6R0_POLDO|nr:PREDICTED: ADP-ribosylation factor-binding protein GGA3 [Polistes dominula]
MVVLFYLSLRYSSNNKFNEVNKSIKMDVVTTSLEALIQRATNPQNQKSDIAAIEAFCVMVTKETEGVQIGSKLLATHIQSSNESEALQALTVLDTCMRRCGPNFHAEVGKFRFLNEMIRLVSPKYLGNTTPVAVRRKVLQLLYLWTKEYPRESKIKEAYEMLRKQGVVEEDSVPIISDIDETFKTPKAKNAIFEDEEKSKLLQKLLQSKNPGDLQAANRLIKTMVKEDERRVQLNSRRIMELESVHNNVKLLSEMLDSYNQNETSPEDLELMKELHQACERLKPTVLRLANETQDSEEMLGDVLAANDALGQVFDKYTAVIILGQKFTKTNINNDPSLLDLSSPIDSASSECTSNVETDKTNNTVTTNSQSDMEVLGDIFNSLGKSMDFSLTADTNILMPEPLIMDPINAQQNGKKIGDNADTPEKKMDSKARALEELNELGESLLKQSLSYKVAKELPSDGKKMSLANVGKLQSKFDHHNSMGLTSTNNNATQQNIIDKSSKNENDKVKRDLISPSFLNGDDTLVDVSQPTDKNKNIETSEKNTSTKVNDIPALTSDSEPMIKSLADINVNLQDIKPGKNPPITVIEEKNGISVVLHFAQDSPRPDVSVIVVTTMSKNAKPLSNYLFQAVVPKKCKCRLQLPSGTELPAHNPFLPPSAITQIMLIANPLKQSVSLKFMLSYTMDDETFTEMGEVDRLPHL